jgi:hydroxyethylthiazole kinase-like uncharacterized protein yjeF
MNITYLTAKQAQQIDEELMSDEHGFSLEQLMENAGISVAHSVVQFINETSINNPNILIPCGPGNNGGDGLVAARHLSHFGFKPTIVYPKQTDKKLYVGLLKQCENLDIEILKDMPDTSAINHRYGLIIDSVFGFSFSGDSLRSPFDQVIGRMKECSVPILAVDVPSGWHVEQGNVHNLGPNNVAALISLTAPKLCAKNFSGVHYLGGRFVPPKLLRKFELDIPEYKGIDTIIKLNK